MHLTTERLNNTTNFFFCQLDHIIMFHCSMVNKARFINCMLPAFFLLEFLDAKKKKERKDSPIYHVTIRVPDNHPRLVTRTQSTQYINRVTITMPILFYFFFRYHICVLLHDPLNPLISYSTSISTIPITTC